MKANSLTIIKKRDIITGLYKESAQSYFKVKHMDNPKLEDLVLGPFEKALKEKTEYDDNSPPAKETVSNFKFDSATFTIVSSPSTKRPSYKDICTNLNKFIEVLVKYKENAKVPGIITIENEYHLQLQAIMDKIKEWKDNVTSGGVSQSISYECDEKIKGCSSIPIDILHSYVKVDEENSLVYIKSDIVYNWNKENIITPFEKKLKERIEYTKENAPAETKYDIIPIEEYFFQLITVPTTEVKYGEILNGLIYDTPGGKVTKKTGVLTKILRGAEDGELSKIKKVRDGQIYISIDWLSQKIKDLTAEATDKNIRQSINAFVID